MDKYLEAASGLLHAAGEKKAKVLAREDADEKHAKSIRAATKKEKQVKARHTRGFVYTASPGRRSKRPLTRLQPQERGCRLRCYLETLQP